MPLMWVWHLLLLWLRHFLLRMLVCHPEREILLQSTTHLGHHHPMQGTPLQVPGTESIRMDENSNPRTRSHRMSARTIIPSTQATKSAHNVIKCGVGIQTHNLRPQVRQTQKVQNYLGSRTNHWWACLGSYQQLGSL